MQTILHNLLCEQNNGRDTVLVTVIRERGSAPRGAGASMLVGERGRLSGTIGGGAAERQSELLAIELLKERRSDERSFVLRPEPGEDPAMICGGDIDVFFRFISAGDANWNAIAREALSRLERRERSLLTIGLSDASLDSLRTEGTAGLSADGSLFGIAVSAGERAILFGAGHICRALAPLLSGVGFCVTVMDERPELVTKDAYPTAERLICGDFSRLSEYLSVGADDYLVVMTHSHTYDLVVQEQLLRGPFAYNGMIGSASKRALVNAKLLEAGIPEDVIGRVHSPVGLKIKAVTPGEIAVSIAAEMILCRAERRAEAGTNEK